MNKKTVTAKNSVNSKATAAEFVSSGQSPDDVDSAVDDIAINKQGQKLGAKGRRTRQALMDAARKLLRNGSPIDLKPVAIAKAADVASASFYMYFEDIRDLLYQMSEIACAEYDTLIPIIDRPWDSGSPETQEAIQFVRAFNEIWARHREVLLFRNLEADHGDLRFGTLWRETLRPIIVHIGDKIRAAAPVDRPLAIGDARAQAVVLTSALERIAAADPKVIASELGNLRQERATALVVAITIRG